MVTMPYAELRASYDRVRLLLAILVQRYSSSQVITTVDINRFKNAVQRGSALRISEFDTKIEIDFVSPEEAHTLALEDAAARAAQGLPCGPDRCGACYRAKHEDGCAMLGPFCHRCGGSEVLT